MKCPCCGKDSTVTANIEEWLSDLSKAPVVFDNDGGWEVDHENVEHLPSSDVENRGTTYTCDNCGKKIDEDELNVAAQSRMNQLNPKKLNAKTK